MNQLRLFGGAVLESNGVPVSGRAAQRHRTALLALLATTRRRFRSRDQLITLLWPETDAERGRRMLSDSIYRINQALGGNVLVGPGEDVRMNRDQITSDVAAFEDAMEARDYPTAVSLYTGAFLDSFFLPGSPEFDRWMEIEREHYAQSMAKALEALALAASGARLVTEAVDHWQQLALLVPDDSRIAMELMRALEVAGNRAGALRHAKRHTELLRETLGFDPDRGVQELATTIASRNVPRDLSRNFARPVIRSIAKPVTKKAGPDAKTYDLYVQARFHWHKRLEESLLLSVSLFEQVLAREPMYARAWAGLADAYSVLAFYDFVRPRPAFEKAEAAARHAILLEKTLAAPHATLAFINTHFHWNWEEAEQGFSTAIALEPGYSTAHQWYGSLLASRGRFDEAEREMRRAAELDPLSLVASAALGWVMMLANENDRALRQFNGALSLDSNFCLALYWSGLAHERSGDAEQAVPLLKRVVKISEGWLNQCSLVNSALARAYALSGNTREARELLEDLLMQEENGRYISSYEVGKVYWILGDVEEALNRLERAYEDRAHSMAYLNVDPQLAELSVEPRFQRLVELVESSYALSS